jgi:hypothetical protein
MERKAARVKNRVRATTLYPTIAAYGLAVVGLYGVMDGGGPLAIGALALVLYLGAAMLTAWMIYQHELSKLWAAPNEFRRHLPFHSYGTVAHSFQHVFYSEAKDVLLDVQRGLKGELLRRGLASNFRVVQLRDADGELTSEDARHFCLATATSSPKNTVVTIAIHPRAEGGTQSISWYVMVAGFVDQDKVFRLVSLAPLTLPFWISGYLRDQVDVISKVRNTYSGFYRDLDLAMTVRAVGDAMRSGLITTLSLLGIDTTELAPVSSRPPASGAVAIGAGEQQPVSQAIPESVRRALGQGSDLAPPPPSGRRSAGGTLQSARLPLPGGVPEDDEVTRPMNNPIPEQLALQKPRMTSDVYRKNKTRAA